MKWCGVEGREGTEEHRGTAQRLQLSLWYSVRSLWLKSYFKHAQDELLLQNGIVPIADEFYARTLSVFDIGERPDLHVE